MIADIQVKRGLLEGDLPGLIQDVLYEIKAPRGRRLFVLFNKPVYDTQIQIVNAQPINHSRNFSQSYLKQSDTIVGSLLDISSRWCCFNSISVGFMPEQEKLTTFVCPTEAPSGGLLVYNDGHGSFYAIPSNQPKNDLLISDRGD